MPAERTHGFYRRYGKRLFDMTAAALGLAAAAAPMAAVALLVKWDDGGPVLFSQRRVGQHGRLITVHKFRTMRVGAEKEGSVTAGGDARITRVGAWLRRWKLDELPQLFDVLIGTMSLVGPRPDVPGYADRLAGEDAAVLELKPGITGPATLAFRDEESLLAAQSDPVRYNDEIVFPKKVLLNLEYKERMSFAQDVKYIVQTVIPE